jgi:hypothetical protein
VNASLPNGTSGCAACCACDNEERMVAAARGCAESARTTAACAWLRNTVSTTTTLDAAGAWAGPPNPSPAPWLSLRLSAARLRARLR